MDKHPKPPFESPHFQKKRDVHKISARNSGAGNGCANFMGAWHFWFSDSHAGKPPVAHKIPPLGGVVEFLEGGGGSANFIFMGVGIFLTFETFPKIPNVLNFPRTQISSENNLYFLVRWAVWASRLDTFISATECHQPSKASHPDRTTFQGVDFRSIHSQ